jgi:hypothetical protein
MQPALRSASAAMRWEPALPPLPPACVPVSVLSSASSRRDEACAARRFAPLLLALYMPGAKLGLVFFCPREGNIVIIIF